MSSELSYVTSIEEVRAKFRRPEDKARPADPALIRGVAEGHSKEYLAEAVLEADEAYDALLKKAILEHGRIDILAVHVLGFGCFGHHRELLAYQFEHPQSLQLVFRGAGKTTILSVAKGIWYIAKDPNLRILIASKTFAQAKDILKEIKHHLQFNEKLVNLFGKFAPSNMNDPNVVWNEREINVLQRRHFTKESNFTALGAESAVVGKHFDVQIVDDLVDEDNSRTSVLRDRIKKFYYKVLDPCLEPPTTPSEPDHVEHRGERHIIGTRYHPEDLYGHLQDNELKDHTQIIPALRQIGEDAAGEPLYHTPWPEKFSVEFFKKKRADQGSIIFDSQYQCDIDKMKGEIFQADWFDHDEIYYDTLPEGCFIWAASDLAISAKDSADKFACVTIARKGEMVYLIDYVWTRLTFHQQTEVIADKYAEHDPVRTGVEANAYQAAQVSNLKAKHEGIRVVPIITHKDKILRAWKLTSIFEKKQVRVKRSHRTFIDHMIQFRKDGEDDLFDAFEMAYTLSHRGARRRRRKEPGLI